MPSLLFYNFFFVSKTKTPWVAIIFHLVFLVAFLPIIYIYSMDFFYLIFFQVQNDYWPPLQSGKCCLTCKIWSQPDYSRSQNEVYAELYNLSPINPAGTRWFMAGFSCCRISVYTHDIRAQVWLGLWAHKAMPDTCCRLFRCTPIIPCGRHLSHCSHPHNGRPAHRAFSCAC